MQIEIISSIVALKRDGLLAVRDGAGTRIECRSGSVWITQEGDVKDVIIVDGESFTIRNPGLTLVTGLEASSIAVIEPEPERGSRSLGVQPSRIGGLKRGPVPCI